MYLQRALGKQEEPAANPTSENPEAVCECLCGCQVEITKAIAGKTTEAVGAARCAECFPDKTFNYQKHSSMSTLGLPKDPALTPARAEAWAKKRRGGA